MGFLPLDDDGRMRRDAGNIILNPMRTVTDKRDCPGPLSVVRPALTLNLRLQIERGMMDQFSLGFACIKRKG